MRFWIAAALLSLGVFDLELGNLTTRWEGRSYAASSAMDDQQAVLEGGTGGFPPR